MNTVTASFNMTVRQITEMSQQTKKKAWHTWEQKCQICKQCTFNKIIYKVVHLTDFK